MQIILFEKYCFEIGIDKTSGSEIMFSFLDYFKRLIRSK